MPIYFVGIDVSKFKHTCCVLSQDGVVERPSFDFPNSKEGFGLLIKTMASLGPKEQILIGMEATGHYGLCLQKALWGEGYKLKAYNPITIEKFRGSETVAGAKTDKLDALLIAKYMSARPFSPTEAMDGTLSEIQSLERAKYFLFRDRARCFNHLHRYLDVSFPELPRFLATKGDGEASTSRKDVFESKTAMALIGKYPSAKKASRLTKKDADALRRMSMGRFSLVKSERLKELARSSVGSSDPATEAVVASLVAQARCIGEQIDSIDAVLEPLMGG
jgi:transposase